MIGNFIQHTKELVLLEVENIGTCFLNQNKELEVKKIEAEKELFNAENELKANTENIMQDSCLVFTNELSLWS